MNWTYIHLQVYGNEDSAEKCEMEIARNEHLYWLAIDGSDEMYWTEENIEYLKDVSKKFPGCLICVEGDGDDCLDVWKERYKNGEYERVEAILPPFTNPNLIEIPT